MPFIGTQPEVGGYSVLDNLTASATASYTLQKDSANFVPSSANQLLVSLNGVIQKPGSSFTVSGSTLTFSSALSSSDSIDFILAMGEPLLVGTPSDATITGSKLASNIGISTTGNIATTGSGTLSVAGNTTLSGTAAITGNTTVGGTLTNTGLITASAGVAIGGTGAANTLDDYEEGTWTPAWSTGSGQTYGQQFGTYVKIGRQVMVTCFIMTSDMNSQTGDASVGGLPFTASQGTFGTFPRAWGVVNGDNNWDTNLSTNNLVAQISGGGNTIRPRYNSGLNTSDVQLQHIGGGNSYFGATVIYETDA